MEDKRVLIKIAQWYYEKGLTQQQIADKLKFSRQKVNRMVSSLVEEGVVVVTINGLDQQFFRMENTLEDIFGIAQVIIADTDQNDNLDIQVVGKKAAELLDQIIADKQKIGISWGITLRETISQMKNISKQNCEVVQLVGGMNASEHETTPDEITSLLARKLSCKYKKLFAPAIIDSKIAKDIISKEQSVRDVFISMEECDIAIMGIGELTDSATIVSQGHTSSEYCRSLQQEGYVGDICFNHFKLDGDFDLDDENNRVIGVGTKTLKKIPSVVAVACGIQKVEAIIGALSTGCIDILVTDSTTSRKILEQIGNNKNI